MDDLSTLQTEIEISKGRGNIIVCMVNTPLLRDRIIEMLSKTFILREIIVKDGEHIVRMLKKEKNEPLGTQYDAWVWILPENENITILNALNIFRELFYDINTPSLVFCNRTFLNAIIRKTPDFWRYRGNYYEFEAEEELPPLSGDIILDFPFSYGDKDDLLRKKRIIEYILDETEDDNEKGTLYGELASIYQILGEPNEALKYFRKALHIDRKMNNKIREASTLGNIGLIYRDRGELDEALTYLEDALAIDREIGYKQGEASTLGNIGLIYHGRGELDEALTYYKDALAIDREIGYKQGEASTLGNIGLIYYVGGELDEALTYLEDALAIDREIGYKQGEADQLGNIGLIYRAKGELDEALTYHKDALAIDREIGHKQGEASTLGNIGLIYRVRGELDEALTYHKDALAIDREIGHKQGEADQLGNIGLIRYVRGELDEALTYLEDALKIFISIGTHPQVLQVYSYLFQVSIKENPVKAFLYMKKALEYAPDEEKALRTIFTFLSLIANLIQAAQWEHLQHITTAQSPHFTELNPFFAAINYYARYQLSKQKEFLKKYEKERQTLNKTLLEILDNLFEKE